MSPDDKVLVKYSEREGAGFHRQLRLPLRIAIRGGLRVCSLRVRTQAGSTGAVGKGGEEQAAVRKDGREGESRRGSEEGMKG